MSSDCIFNEAYGLGHVPLPDEEPLEKDLGP